MPKSNFDLLLDKISFYTEKPVTANQLNRYLFMGAGQILAVSGSSDLWVPFAYMPLLKEDYKKHINEAIVTRLSGITAVQLIIGVPTLPDKGSGDPSIAIREIADILVERFVFELSAQAPAI